MAAVARAVGAPGVQQVGYPCLLPAVPLHRYRTGGMPLPPPRHPAASFRRSPVPWAGGGTRAGQQEHPLRRFGGSSGVRGVGWRTLEHCCVASALLGFGSAVGAVRVRFGLAGFGGGWNRGTPLRCLGASLVGQGLASAVRFPAVGTGGFVVAVDGRLRCRCGSASPVSGGRYRVPVRCTGQRVGAVGGGRDYWNTGTPLLSVWASRRSPLPSFLPRRSPAAIPTLVSEDSDSFEAASSRCLALSTMVEVTAAVTVRAVSRAFWRLLRLLVEVATP